MKHIKLFESWINEGANINMEHSDSNSMIDFAVRVWNEVKKLGSFQTPWKSAEGSTTYNPVSATSDIYVEEGEREDGTAFTYVALVSVEGTGSDYLISLEPMMDGGSIESVKVCSDIEEGWEDHDEIEVKVPTPMNVAKAVQQIIKNLPAK